MPVLEERVSRIEKAVEEFVKNVGIEFNKLYNSQMRTEMELRDFKDEMKAFKDEMKAFKDEMRQQNRDMNLKWGEMANKLGTIVEDLVHPSLPRIINEEFNLDVDFLGIRIKRKLKDGRVKEYDAIAVAGEYVFLNYTKSTLKTVDVQGFIEEIKMFREFFPEYKKNKLIGVLASLYVDESVVKYAEKAGGFMVLAVGDKLMEVVNTKGFKPKEW